MARHYVGDPNVNPAAIEYLDSIEDAFLKASKKRKRKLAASFAPYANFLFLGDKHLTLIINTAVYSDMLVLGSEADSGSNQGNMNRFTYLENPYLEVANYENNDELQMFHRYSEVFEVADPKFKYTHISSIPISAEFGKSVMQNYLQDGSLYKENGLKEFYFMNYVQVNPFIDKVVFFDDTYPKDTKHKWTDIFMQLSLVVYPPDLIAGYYHVRQYGSGNGIINDSITLGIDMLHELSMGQHTTYNTTIFVTYQGDDPDTSEATITVFGIGQLTSNFQVSIFADSSTIRDTIHFITVTFEGVVSIFFFSTNSSIDLQEGEQMEIGQTYSVHLEGYFEAGGRRLITEDFTWGYTPNYSDIDTSLDITGEITGTWDRYDPIEKVYYTGSYYSLTTNSDTSEEAQACINIVTVRTYPGLNYTIYSAYELTDRGMVLANPPPSAVIQDIGTALGSLVSNHPGGPCPPWTNELVTFSTSENIYRIEYDIVSEEVVGNIQQRRLGGFSGPIILTDIPSATYECQETYEYDTRSYNIWADEINTTLIGTPYLNEDDLGRIRFDTVSTVMKGAELIHEGTRQHTSGFFNKPEVFGPVSFPYDPIPGKVSSKDIQSANAGIWKFSIFAFRFDQVYNYSTTVVQSAKETRGELVEAQGVYTSTPYTSGGFTTPGNSLDSYIFSPAKIMLNTPFFYSGAFTHPITFHLMDASFNKIGLCEILLDSAFRSAITNYHSHFKIQIQNSATLYNDFNYVRWLKGSQQTPFQPELDEDGIYVHQIDPSSGFDTPGSIYNTAVTYQDTLDAKAATAVVYNDFMSYEMLGSLLSDYRISQKPPMDVYLLVDPTKINKPE